LSDAEHMTWLIINHVFDLIFLLTEPPVHDFMRSVINVDIVYGH